MSAEIAAEDRQGAAGKKSLRQADYGVFGC